MSSQRGNANRTRAQKHQNSIVFNNKMHDTSKKTKQIISSEVEGCCPRCKDIIEWRKKYKKYKPPTQPKKCLKCSERAVYSAYCSVCQPCVEKYKICAKCSQKKDGLSEFQLSPEDQARQQAQLEQELKMLPERKRRTFLRAHAQGLLTGGDAEGGVGSFEGEGGEDSEGEEGEARGEGQQTGSEDEEDENQDCAVEGHKAVGGESPQHVKSVAGGSGSEVAAASSNDKNCGNGTDEDTEQESMS